MLKLCMKTLQCVTKVLLFCFEVKNNSNIILKREIIQHDNVEIAGNLARKTLRFDEKMKSF